MDCNNCINRLLPICARCFERASKFEPKPIVEKKPEARVYSIIPTTEKENIRRMYFDEQLSLKNIGKEYNVSLGTIARFVKLNFTTNGRTKSNSRTNVDAELAKSLYATGLSTQDVALEMGESPGTIYNVLKDVGVEMRTNRRNGKAKYEQL